MRLWKRTYKLNFPTLGLYIADSLEVTFEIDKDLTKESNKAKVEILNLSNTTRQRLETNDLPVEIYAGYDGQPALMYKGTVYAYKTENTGKDEKTTLELGDGVTALRDSVFSLSFAPGTSTRTILESIAAHMGLAITFGDDVTFSSLPSGYSFVGQGGTALDEVCGAGGFTWSIQNDVIQIIMAGGTTTTRGLVFGQSTGLLGSPVRIIRSNYKSDEETPKRKRRKKQKKEKPTKKAGWKIKTLLASTVSPGDAVKVESKTISGWFRVESIKHSGDYQSGDWASEMELIEGLAANANTE